MLTKGGRLHTGFLFDSSRDKLTFRFIRMHRGITLNVTLQALFWTRSTLTCKVHHGEAVKIKTSPCRVRTASSSPLSGTLSLCLHRSCLSLWGVRFHKLAWHVSADNKKQDNYFHLITFKINHYASTGVNTLPSWMATGSPKQLRAGCKRKKQKKQKYDMICSSTKEQRTE